ncbi:hypothetical protein [Streptomyces sp. NPDC088178]|uniref:hypothetical protein n=1 Tax=Streptomyces sp. NPDC088178 TaxID=3365836 RepID=UPI0037F6F0CD
MGIVAGLVSVVDGFGNLFFVGGTDGVSVGAGVGLLSPLSVVMLAAAVLILLPARQSSAIPPMPSMPSAQPPQN